MAGGWPWKAATNHLDDGQPSFMFSTQPPSTVSPGSRAGCYGKACPCCWSRRLPVRGALCFAARGPRPSNHTSRP